MGAAAPFPPASSLAAFADSHRLEPMAKGPVLWLKMRVLVEHSGRTSIINPVNLGDSLSALRTYRDLILCQCSYAGYKLLLLEATSHTCLCFEKKKMGSLRYNVLPTV